VGGVDRDGERAGDLQLVPTPARARSAAAMTRRLCTLAHYLELGGTHAQLDDFVAIAGFEVITRGSTAVPRDGDAELPAQMTAARCSGTTCLTDDERLELSYARDAGALVLHAIRITDRPGCR
jgi:hypothetical protein